MESMGAISSIINYFKHDNFIFRTSQFGKHFNSYHTNKAEAEKIAHDSNWNISSSLSEEEKSKLIIGHLEKAIETGESYLEKTEDVSDRKYLSLNPRHNMNRPFYQAVIFVKNNDEFWRYHMICSPMDAKDLFMKEMEDLKRWKQNRHSDLEKISLNHA